MGKSQKKRISKTKHNKNNKVIYFDNNGTTLLCKEGEKAQRDHLRCYNPASDSSVSEPEKKILKDAREYLCKLMNCSENEMTIIFTSGATESNCCMLRSVAEAYKRLTDNIPHYIVSEIEHASIIECVHSLLKNNNIEVTWIKPTVVGSIQPSDIEKAIKKETALIVAMYANNEIGTITDIKRIADIAHQHDIPLFSDCVQIFGKHQIDLQKNGIDALSVSFHKLYGPKRIGLLVIRNDLIDGYQLEAQINGHQQNNLRGGTEDPAGVAGAIASCKWNFAKREEKNKILFDMRNCILQQLKNKYSVMWYQDFMQLKHDVIPTMCIIIFGPKDEQNNMQRAILPNTILMSIYVADQSFCNVNFKKILDKHGIIISIGSACNTNSKTASHVIKSLIGNDKYNTIIKKGMLRISLGDYNKKTECNKFIEIFTKELDKYLITQTLKK